MFIPIGSEVFSHWLQINENIDLIKLLFWLKTAVHGRDSTRSNPTENISDDMDRMGSRAYLRQQGCAFVVESHASSSYGATFGATKCLTIV